MKKTFTFKAIARLNKRWRLRAAAVLLLAGGTFLTASAQGPGNNFLFSTQTINLPGVTLSGSYTKEAWVYWTGNANPGSFYNILSGQNSAFWVNNGHLSAGHNNNFVEIQDAALFSPNVWTHVAVTFNSGTNQLSLYKNGILVAGPITSLSIGIADPVQQIGAFFDGSSYVFNWSGNLDEVRLWNRVLTQAEIRNAMCRKYTVPTTNLVNYYRLDASTGTVATDETGNNNGAVIGTASWAVSGAPIGDASTHDYVNATKTASITNAGTGESLTVTSTSGAPSGIHVYLVNAAPSNIAGVLGLGTNDKYFGVFQVNGTSPQYTAVYNYNNQIPATGETDLRLFKRTNNAAASWSSTPAVQNTTANTLTLTGESTEYILGSTGAALPVTFESFTANRENNGVKLTWKTGAETNNKGFEIQRSNANNEWKSIGFVNADPNGARGSVYSFVDASPLKGTNYYRLNQVDLDNHSKYSDVRSINNPKSGGISVYPVPARSNLTIDLNETSLLNSNVQVLDMQGKLLKTVKIVTMQQSLPVDDLRPGNYLLRFKDESVLKFIKQ